MSGNAKQRTTLTNLNEPQQMRELNRQLTWIWDQLLGGLGLKALNTGARKVIDSKASCEEVDELSGTVEKYGTQIQQSAKEIALKADKTVVDELGNVVSSHSTSITQTAEQIESVAKSVEEIDGRVAENESKITQTPEEIRLAVQSVRSGGTNLLKDSKLLTTGTGADHWRISWWDVVSRLEGDSGFFKAKFEAGGLTEDKWGGIASPVTRLPAGWHGRQMTLSFWVYADDWANMNGSINPITVGLCLSQGGIGRLNYGSKNINKTGKVELIDGVHSDMPLENGKWARVSMTWTLNRTEMAGGDGDFDANTHVFVQFFLRRNGYYEVYAPKLEFGNKASEWSPAPEDVDGAIGEISAELVVQAGEISANATKIETVKGTADQAATNLTAVTTRVTTAEQSISALDGQIQSKVSQTDFNALGERVSGAEAAITTQAGEIVVNATKIEEVRSGYYGIKPASGTIVQADGLLAGQGIRAKSSFELAQAGSGEASPSNIRPIAGRTGAKLTRCGRNLLKPEINAGNKYAAYAQILEDGRFYVNNTTDSTVYPETPEFILPAGQYTVQTYGMAAGMQLYVQSARGDYSRRITNTSPKLTFTAERDQPLWLMIVCPAGLADAFAVWVAAGVEDAEQSLHQGDVFYADFGRTVYGGTLEWNTGVLMAEWVGRDFDGTEAISQVVENTNTVRVVVSLGSTLSQANPESICSHLPRQYSTNDAMHFYVATTFYALYIPKSALTGFDEAGVKAYLAAQYAAGTPVQIAYRPDEPMEIRLEPQDIISLEGWNTVYTDLDWNEVEFGHESMVGLGAASGYDLNEAVQRITKAEVDISALDGKISSKVERAEFNALGAEVDRHGTLIQQTAEDILLQAGRTVGGTNYLRDSARSVSNSEYLVASYYFSDGLKPKVGETMTARIWGKLGEGKTGFALYNTNAMLGLGSLNNNGDGSYSATFDWIMSREGFPDYEVTEQSQTHLRVYAYPNSVTGVASTITKIKLERGDYATDWTPHPDDPSAGVNTGTAGGVRVKITPEEFDVDVPGEDGDFILNEAGGQLPVLVGKDITAPNVTPRYDGPAVLNADPNATSAQIAAGNYFRSLADAFARLSNKWIAGNVTVNVAAGATEYGTLTLRSTAGGGFITIQGDETSHAKLVGKLQIYTCMTPVVLRYVDIDAPVNSKGIDVSGGYCDIANCVITGKGTGGTVGGAENTASVGILAQRGANVLVGTCELYDVYRALYTQTVGQITAANNKGNCIVGANRTHMFVSGTAPSDSASQFNYSEVMGGKVWPGSVTVDQGSRPTAEPEPVTAAFSYLYSDSYCAGWNYYSNEDIWQGWIKRTDSGEQAAVYGVMWFDAAAIRSALTGRTIKQASLRLHMMEGVGRGVQVSVQLYGTSMAYSGRSGQPALTTSYGTIIEAANPGEVHEITIPAAVVSDIVSGRIQALVLKSDDTALHKNREYSKNYARFAGSSTATAADCPRLTVVYK